MKHQILVKETKNYLNGNKIKDSLEEEIKNKLKYIFSLIGLNKIPDPVDSKILIEYIKNDLKKYYINELVLAFKLALRGEIEVDLNHYNVFSVHYLCRVIREYEKWCRASKISRPKQIALEEQNPLTDSAKDQIIKESLICEYHYYKKHNEFKNICSYIYFDYLWRNKLINPSKREITKIKSVSETELKTILEKEKSTVSNIYDVRNISKKILNLTSENEFKNLCKINYLKQLFDKKEINKILCLEE